MVDLVTELSYRKSAKEPERQARGVILSGTAVMGAIRQFDLKGAKFQPPRKKRRVRVLFVEADEGPVAGQRGGVRLPRLVYIHEGKEQVGKGRYRLKRPHYLAGIYQDPEELWYEVLDSIDQHYELDQAEIIFLCGDWDSWIIKGLTILPKMFVLDLFHLDQYLMAALGRDTEGYWALRGALTAGDWSGVRALLQRAERGAATPAWHKALRECRRSIRRNWEGILAYRRYPEARLGISADGHVSHILAARLSSRPLAWSKTGADQMAWLRAMKANGVNLQEQYLVQRRCQLSPLKVEKSYRVRERQKLKRAAGEVLDKVPALRDPVTQLRRVLKGISRDVSLI